MAVSHMIAESHFHQECPTCGRTLVIRVEYRGRRVCCAHCRAPFDPGDGTAQQAQGRMRRVDELLARAARLRQQPVSSARAASHPHGA